MPTRAIQRILQRIMTVRTMSVLCAAVAASAPLSTADAGVWAWGCQGKLGDQQVILNRYGVRVIDTKEKLGNIHKIINDELGIVTTGEGAIYESIASESETAPLQFIRDKNDKLKLLMTEKSSKKISSKSKLICGRDESTELTRKVYRYQREDEPARDITMQCIDYQLSTMGGRRCD
jgi:hypothetical protein